LHASKTDIYKIVIHVLLYCIVASFYELQHPFKDAVVSDLFYASR